MTRELSSAADAQPSPEVRPGILQRYLAPSVADWVFVAVLGWLFAGAAGAVGLLGDGDTGWHIRTGESILAGDGFPRVDPYSYSMEGRTWYAWEWLADVALAVAHQIDGLRGVVVLAGVVIAATAAALLRFMTWQGTNLVVAILGMLAVCSASMVHWLARPHMFTWGFLLATLWLFEADRRRPSLRIWWLVPLAVVWTNTHGGFVALLVVTAIYATGGTVEEIWERYRRGEGFSWKLPEALRRYGLVGVVCAAATLLNPYGYHLHEHIGAYLQSDFILTHVHEFQAPDFRGESERVYEATLFLSLGLCGLMLFRREITTALLIAAWAHASLTSMRHMPLFMLVAVPFLAGEISFWIAEGAKRGNSWLQALQDLAEDYGGARRYGSERGPLVFNPLGLAAIAALVWVLHAKADEWRWSARFPEDRFPVTACDNLGERMMIPRLLTSDQWGDYLIYRYHPERKVFFDGRSDFYDPEIREDYVRLIGTHWRWEEVVDRYEFDALLVPLSWGLSSVLKQSADWRLVYDDGLALYFERATKQGSYLSSRATRGSTGQGRVELSRSGRRPGEKHLAMLK